jgi:OOP family OmpA-OmpF porin
MKITFRTLLVTGGIFAASALAASPALAQNVGGYAGASLGMSSSSDFNDFCDEAKAFDPGASCTKNPLGLKLFGGYQFNPNFAAEGGYYSTGDFKVSAGGGSQKASATSLFVAGVGMMPVSPTVSLMGKIGMQFWDVKTSGSLGSSSDSGNDLFYGIGGKFAVGERSAIRVEYEIYKATVDGGDFNVNFLSAGFEMKFN